MKHQQMTARALQAHRAVPDSDFARSLVQAEAADNIDGFAQWYSLRFAAPVEGKRLVRAPTSGTRLVFAVESAFIFAALPNGAEVCCKLAKEQVRGLAKNSSKQGRDEPQPWIG